ncbi:hypothetical protein C7B09_20220 [Escherichia albertii]|uniref:Secreted protein n=1 Tax=Escherichia albertii TaxID=208962 RepID=A0ABX5HE93_ESCAL|nr:hypothetical protein C7B09_20220 [Escherichia albertii]
MPDATLARLIMPTMGTGLVGRIRRLRRIRRCLCSGAWCQGACTLTVGRSTQISPQIARHCHHTVIFPIETNVTKLVFYS